jgi:vacuolar-type H+-ATPase subunit C/Vma6
MTLADDGGQAFPFVEWRSPDGMVSVTKEPGMTLRDYFAAQAIDGLINRLEQDALPDMGQAAREVAEAAYEIADAMIRARAAIQTAEQSQS